MKVDVMLAREILELTEGQAYDESAVNAAYRKAIKAVHPDAGGTAALATLVTECREVLLEALKENNTKSQPQEKKQNTPASGNWAFHRKMVDLGTLYGVYPDLQDYAEEYNPELIEANFLVKLVPLLAPRQELKVLVTAVMPFDEFLENREAVFEAKIELPHTIRKHRLLKVETCIRSRVFSIVSTKKQGEWEACYRHPRFNTTLRVVLA